MGLNAIQVTLAAFSANSPAHRPPMCLLQLAVMPVEPLHATIPPRIWQSPTTLELVRQGIGVS